jgi:acyl carrier protein
MAMTTEARVITILARQAGVPAAGIGRDTTLAELGLDSLGLVETIFALEEAFSIAIPFNANTPGSGSFDLSTVGGIVAGVDALCASAAA